MGTVPLAMRPEIYRAKPDSTHDVFDSGRCDEGRLSGGSDASRTGGMFLEHRARGVDFNK
jgi:hypothetical protein